MEPFHQLSGILSIALALLCTQYVGYIVYANVSFWFLFTGFFWFFFLRFSWFFGFLVFSLVFWQTTKGVDWQKLADEVNKVLEGSDAVISSLGVYGNPLEKDELDLETLKGFNEIIDNAHLFNCNVVAAFDKRRAIAVICQINIINFHAAGLGNTE